MVKSTTIVIIICSILLISCKSQTNEEKIEGNWKTEGMSVSFDGKGTLTSKEEGNKNEKFIAYKLIKDGQYIVSQEKNSTKPDTVKIIELTGKILKIVTSEKDTVVFEKVQ